MIGSVGQITAGTKANRLVLALIAALLLAYQAMTVLGLRDEVQALLIEITALSSVTGRLVENEVRATALSAPDGYESLYSAVNEISSDSALSLTSYEEILSAESGSFAVRGHEVALQATATYPNILTFLTDLRKAHPNVVLISATLDRKEAEAGRSQGPNAETLVLAAVRLRISAR